MAYVSSHRSAPSILPAWAAEIYRSLALRAARNRRYYQTMSELSSLTDRELADINVHRSMIRQIANEAAALEQH